MSFDELYQKIDRMQTRILELEQALSKVPKVQWSCYIVNNKHYFKASVKELHTTCVFDSFFFDDPTVFEHVILKMQHEIGFLMAVGYIRKLPGNIRY